MRIKTETVKRSIFYAIAALAVVSTSQVGYSQAGSPGMSAAEQALAIEEIHQLKARYIRCMDMKDWVCWEGVFARDFQFKAGDLQFHSAKEMVQATHKTGLFERVKTVSHAITPEITMLSPTTAKGSWGCDFLHYFPAGSTAAQGQEIVAPGHWNHTDGYYYDTYVKIGGKWFIQSEEIHSLRETEGVLGK